MKQYIKNYLVAFMVFLVIDLIWLGLVSKDFYQQELGYIMSDSPNWVVAFIFYVIFIFGLLFFVLNPALKSGSFKEALLKGLFFGLISYATYNLTNYATLKDWPLSLTIVDLIWGTTLGGLVSSISFLIFNKKFKS